MISCHELLKTESLDVHGMIVHAICNSYICAMRSTNRYALLTGSDASEKGSYIRQARALIRQRVGSITEQSDEIETEPWGFESNTKFLNQALLVESSLGPEQVLAEIHIIEQQLGRVRTEQRWSSRTIDIDILCSDQLTLRSETLTIPHPLLHLRYFALEPLVQIAGMHTHPVLHRTYAELLAELRKTESFAEDLAEA